MEKVMIKKSELMKCPLFGWIFNDSRDWKKVSEEISSILDEIDEKYLGATIEYNTNTSAGHPAKDDDIVRYSFEKRRVKDKEP